MDPYPPPVFQRQKRSRKALVLTLEGYNGIFSPIFKQTWGLELPMGECLQDRVGRRTDELSILACYTLRGAILIVSVVFLP